MKRHGNSNENDAAHHLYEIRDQEENETYKYGRCGDPLNADGSSPRANRQVKEYNRAVRWARFYAQVLRSDIPGRVAARNLEIRQIEEFEQQNGRKPAGNE